MRFRSPLLSQSRFLSFPPGTEMVHFPGFARARLWIHRAVRRFYPRGFPHSEIPGSKPACGSPRLIAACHVLLRLLLPRHSPCALSSLTIKLTRGTRIPGYQLLALHQTTRIRRENLMAPSCSSHAYSARRAARKMQHPCSARNANSLQEIGKTSGCYVHQQDIGTHKTYSLVDCPIYSVVKHRPRRLTSAARLSGMSCFQLNIRHQSNVQEPGYGIGCCVGAQH